MGYFEAFNKWIGSYHSAISNLDKSLIVAAFKVNDEDNTECTLLVATDVYSIGIDNPDIKFVIQLDLPASLDTMIQYMGRAGRKG